MSIYVSVYIIIIHVCLSYLFFTYTAVVTVRLLDVMVDWKEMIKKGYKSFIFRCSPADWRGRRMKRLPKFDSSSFSLSDNNQQPDFNQVLFTLPYNVNWANVAMVKLELFTTHLVTSLKSNRCGAIFIPIKDFFLNLTIVDISDEKNTKTLVNRVAQQYLLTHNTADIPDKYTLNSWQRGIIKVELGFKSSHSDDAAAVLNALHDDENGSVSGKDSYSSYMSPTGPGITPNSSNPTFQPIPSPSIGSGPPISAISIPSSSNIYESVDDTTSAPTTPTNEGNMRVRRSLGASITNSAQAIGNFVVDGTNTIKSAALPMMSIHNRESHSGNMHLKLNIKSKLAVNTLNNNAWPAETFLLNDMVSNINLIELCAVTFGFNGLDLFISQEVKTCVIDEDSVEQSMVENDIVMKNKARKNIIKKAHMSNSYGHTKGDEEQDEDDDFEFVVNPTHISTNKKIAVKNNNNMGTAGVKSAPSKVPPSSVGSEESSGGGVHIFLKNGKNSPGDSSIRSIKNKDFCGLCCSSSAATVDAVVPNSQSSQHQQQRGVISPTTTNTTNTNNKPENKNKLFSTYYVKTALASDSVEANNEPNLEDTPINSKQRIAANKKLRYEMYNKNKASVLSTCKERENMTESQVFFAWDKVLSMNPITSSVCSITLAVTQYHGQKDRIYGEEVYTDEVLQMFVLNCPAMVMYGFYIERQSFIDIRGRIKQVYQLSKKTELKQKNDKEIAAANELYTYTTSIFNDLNEDAQLVEEALIQLKEKSKLNSLHNTNLSQRNDFRTIIALSARSIRIRMYISCLIVLNSFKPKSEKLVVAPGMYEYNYWYDRRHSFEFLNSANQLIDQDFADARQIKLNDTLETVSAQIDFLIQKAEKHIITASLRGWNSIKKKDEKDYFKIFFQTIINEFLVEIAALFEMFFSDTNVIRSLKVSHSYYYLLLQYTFNHYYYYNISLVQSLIFLYIYDSMNIF